jgi:RNA polymerase sigma-B factor
MAKAKRKAPDRQQVERIVVEYRRTGDTGLRDQLISQHLYLVQTVARKFSGLGESHEDLLQEGAMGLINAVDLFDPERGVQFSTYATHLVEGQIRHYLRDRGKLIKQPAWVQELTTKIIKATDALTQDLNRAPTLEEVAERVGTSTSNIRRMLEARERSKVASLDSARTDDDGQGPAVDPEKLRTDDLDDVHLPIEDKIFLREAMSRLKTLERKVVHLFYYLDLNQTEIARRLGISVNYASYLLRRAVAKLKQAFESTQEQTWVDSQLDEEESGPAETYSLSLRSAPTDGVTNLPTGHQFLDRVAQEVARATRYPQQFSLILTEPDNGDPGEQEMLSLARLLRTNVRSIDLVARLSHARFALLLPHTGREAGVLAERIVRTVAARLNGPAQELTVSAGYAVFPTDGRTMEDLVSAVEDALAAARQEGGDRSIRAEKPAQNRKEQAWRATG